MLCSPPVTPAPRSISNPDGAPPIAPRRGDPRESAPEVLIFRGALEEERRPNRVAEIRPDQSPRSQARLLGLAAAQAAGELIDTAPTTLTPQPRAESDDTVTKTPETLGAYV